MERIIRRLVGTYTITATATDADDVEVTVTAPATFIVADFEGTSVATGTATVAGAEMTAVVANDALDEGNVFSITFAYTVMGLAQSTRVYFEVYDDVSSLTEIADANTNLASVADLELYGYSTSAGVMLTRASARVRGYTRQAITAGTSTVTIDYPFRLPQRPVTSITSVTDADGTAIAADDYTLRGSYLVFDNRYIADRLDTPYTPSSPVIVTYTHGFITLPDELVEVVCSIAARMYAASEALMSGVRSEQAGGEMVTYGADAYAGTSELTQAEKNVLDRLFPRVPSVVIMT